MEGKVKVFWGSQLIKVGGMMTKYKEHLDKGNKWYLVSNSGREICYIVMRTKKSRYSGKV